MASEKQNVMVIGGGGREAAIVWKLAQSPRVGKIWCAPGNSGMKNLAERVLLEATDLDGICKFARKNPVDVVFVAPDDPLALGLVNRLRAIGIRTFGPTKAAARIEASKEFAKSLMHRRSIPTADFLVFDHSQDAFQYLAQAKYPLVIKADGLALGKGVRICRTYDDAAIAVQDLMVDKMFGDSGNKILIEEYLEGEEVTLMVFTDGTAWRAMPPTRDYKRALDNNEGLNTGGMGSICPSHVFSESEWAALAKDIIDPTLKGMREINSHFQGVLYFGLMLTNKGPKVIEYNARFGDPETQVVLPLLKTDLLDIMDAVIDGTLADLDLEWENQAAACVVLASGGYPEAYERGLPIKGLRNWPLGKTDEAEYRERPLRLVFTAGVEDSYDQQVTAGGRVMAVVSRDKDLETCLKTCYEMADTITFENRHYRKDIGS